MHNSYIVRVYRHEKDNPRMLVGTVEKVGVQGKTAFTNLDELWEIVNAETGLEIKVIEMNDTQGKAEMRKVNN